MTGGGGMATCNLVSAKYGTTCFGDSVGMRFNDTTESVVAELKALAVTNGVDDQRVHEFSRLGGLWKFHSNRDRAGDQSSHAAQGEPDACQHSGNSNNSPPERGRRNGPVVLGRGGAGAAGLAVVEVGMTGTLTPFSPACEGCRHYQNALGRETGLKVDRGSQFDSNERYGYLTLHQIALVKAEHKYTLAVLPSGRELFLHDAPALRTLEQGGRLPGFFRVSRSALVNPAHVIGYHKDASLHEFAVMAGGVRVAVARRHLADWHRLVRALGLMTAEIDRVPPAIQEMAIETASLDPDAMKQRVEWVTQWVHGQ